MDSRRRSAMPPPDTIPPGRSHIPLPTTAKKPTPNSSMGRPSLSNPIRTPFSNQGSGGHRQSMYRSQNQNPLLSSASKPTFGRTPLNNSTRRTSLWPGASGSSQSSQPAKDTRPLRDKAYQVTMRQELLAFLKQAGLEIGMSTLTNIQAKDYRSIFDFLILTLDTHYPIPDPAKVKLEDYFKQTLTYLRYPYVAAIDLKWLVAPASMHSWPVFLDNHPTLQVASDIPDEFEDPLDHRAIVFEFFRNAYTLWLGYNDDMIEAKQALEDRYGRKNEVIQCDFDEKSQLVDKAKIEYDKLKKSAAPIATLQNENNLLQGDYEKFQKILHQYDIRKAKSIDTISQERADLARKDENLIQMKAELEKLNHIVKTQNLTPEEVIRMTTDHDNLQRSLEDLAKKIAETQRIVMNLEVNVTNRAAATEEAIETYMSMLSSLGLFAPMPPPFQDIDFTLELNTAAANPQQLISGADIKSVIKPNLNLVAETKRMERADVENERLRVDHEFDQLMTECENIDLDTTEVMKKVAALNQQSDDLRDAAQQEALVASKEAERLERDLAHARTVALANGMGVKQRLQGLQIEYQEQLEKVLKVKEQTVRAIIKSSHDIAMFKNEVSRNLADLKDFAEMDAS
ncbi:hypothetical protein BDZ89DRAFT_1088792 [Hymenopellis radicata]|nr:hypothetical protein BDZ89DRAFT_1088792 [Hymenopellis radicata]